MDYAQERAAALKAQALAAAKAKKSNLGGPFSTTGAAPKAIVREKAPEEHDDLGPVPALRRKDPKEIEPLPVPKTREEMTVAALAAQTKKLNLNSGAKEAPTTQATPNAAPKESSAKKTGMSYSRHLNP